MWNWVNSTLSNYLQLSIDTTRTVRSDYCSHIQSWILPQVRLIYSVRSNNLTWITCFDCTWKVFIPKEIIKPDIQQLEVREKLDAWSVHSHLLMILACAYIWRLTFIYHRSRVFSNIHVYFQSLTWPWFFQEF